MFIQLVVAALYVSCVYGLDATSWSGSFQDNIYGGSLDVCLTWDSDTSTMYGQGLFSKVGYIRGVIVDNTTWTGSYCLSGQEGTTGTFTLELSDPGNSQPLSYSGMFYQNPGVMYTMSGNQTDTNAPTSSECFASDLSVLKMTDTYTYTGQWLTYNYGHNTSAFRYMYSADGVFTTSYDYWIDNSLYGYAIGYTGMNGQVGMANWYEAGGITKGCTYMSLKMTLISILYGGGFQI